MRFSTKSSLEENCSHQAESPDNGCCPGMAKKTLTTEQYFPLLVHCYDKIADEKQFKGGFVSGSKPEDGEEVLVAGA